MPQLSSRARRGSRDSPQSLSGDLRPGGHAPARTLPAWSSVADAPPSGSRLRSSRGDPVRLPPPPRNRTHRTDHADAVAAALEAAGAHDADVIAHSMGGAVAIVLAARHPHLVARLVLVDANLDPAAPDPARPGSSGIAARTEREFLTGGLEEMRDRVGPHWWATMRLAGPEALHRTAVHLARGTTPTMRELLLDLEIPRTYLRLLDDGPLPGEDTLTEHGVRVVATPECGHTIMLDSPEAFAEATASALTGP
ncbi:alpha/beta fold hydrolase [Streptomyces sp. NPDC056304]|uniref:alpha/beta fold hydrolase n=1 Tax=Streptomyces sp. NPDC056304 TaxID=3345778 RepID=UPI0035D96514